MGNTSKRIALDTEDAARAIWAAADSNDVEDIAPLLQAWRGQPAVIDWKNPAVGVSTTSRTTYSTAFCYPYPSLA